MRGWPICLKNIVTGHGESSDFAILETKTRDIINPPTHVVDADDYSILELALEKIRDLTFGPHAKPHATIFRIIIEVKKAIGLDDKFDIDSVRCPCGDIILADTEDWTVPLCYNCYPKHLVDALETIKKGGDGYNLQQIAESALKK